MGLLGRSLAAGLVALAGCYSPTVLDCTVSCGSPHDCVSGQICGNDGLCAAPEVAGRCGGLHDAALPRDAAGSDGSAIISLHVQITGKGSVFVEGRGTCSSMDPQRGDCIFGIPLDVAQTVEALAIEPDQAFTSWTSVTCNGPNARCTFIPVAATVITAKFEHNKADSEAADRPQTPARSAHVPPRHVRATTPVDARNQP